jgi:hypothetical protein
VSTATPDVLAIDPGGARKKCALVYAPAGRIEAWVIETFERGAPRGSPTWAGGAAGSIDYVVIERPQQDGRSHAARPADLMAISWEGALLAAAYAAPSGAALVELEPREWKGTEPKAQQHARLWAVLSAAERRVLGGDTTARAIATAREKGALKRWAPHSDAYYPRAFAMADVLDAAALAAVFAGRLEKRCT